MPQFKIRYVSEDALMSVGGRLLDRLAAAVGCDRSWLKLELEPTRRFGDAGPEPSEPYVEVHWFDRPEEVRRQVAAILAEELRGDAEYVAVEFAVIPPDGYYENGRRFD